MTAQDSAHPETHRRGRSIPAFVCAGVAAVVVLAVPFAARHLDGTADEFSTRTMPILPALGWAVVAMLAAVVITHRVQIWFHVDEGAVLATTYDVLPLLLLLAPLIAVVAFISDHLLLAAGGAALALYLPVLVVPRFRSSEVPTWAASAPRFKLAVANVFVDNPTPQKAADQLVACGADVIVIAEATPDFMSHFDAAGGDSAYPHRVTDPDDCSEYAVAIVAREPLGDNSRVVTSGELHLALAEVNVSGMMTTVIAINPMSSFDPDGQEIWKQQICALKEFVPTIPGPLVIAGDFNSTRFRPQFDDLLEAGDLKDAIDSLGQSWRPSFSLSSVWPLGALGAIVRLDQALTNDQVCSLHVHNMNACGSDHIPFTITFAVRPPQ